MLISLIAVIYIICLSFLFAYTLSQLVLVFFYYRYKNKHLPIVALQNAYPTVTVQLPLYNEKYVATRLIAAIIALDYPKDALEIQVLDDSTDETSAMVAALVRQYSLQGFRIVHLQRAERKGFKAGALREGMSKAAGSFIAIFDADFLPPSDFLLRILPHFHSADVAAVQTRWGHLNRNASLLTRLQSLQLDLHFTFEQAGRFRSGGCCQFNGTAGVWRKTAIEKAGNWHDDTLTEDLDLSYRAQLQGMKIVYVETIIAPAELPDTMAALKSQQFRWTKGAAECFRKLFLQIVCSKKTLLVKLLAVSHLSASILFPVILVIMLCTIILPFYPSVFVFFGSLPSLFFSTTFFLFCIYFLNMVQLNSYQQPLVRRLLSFCVNFPLFICFSNGLTVHNAVAVLEGLFGKKSEFVRTPKIGAFAKKTGRSYKSNSSPFIHRLELLMMGLLALAIVNDLRLQAYSYLFFHSFWQLGFLFVKFYKQ